MSAHRTAPGTSRLHELDILRLLAALVVMVYHYTCADQQLPEQRAAREFYPELQSYSNYGYLGVDLFFLISGFVILMSAWGRRPGDFALSRFVRLFPAYWVSALTILVVFLSTGLFWTVPGVPNQPAQDFLPNLTMLQKGIGVPFLDGVYWTLWVELHFYALVVPLLWHGLTYRRCLVSMAGWLLLSVYAQEGKNPLLVALLVPKYAPYFIAGMAFFLIYRYGSNPVPWMLVGACWALRCHYGFEVTGSPRAIDGYRIAIPALTTVIFVIMGLVATHRLSWLRWKGLATLGALTYPLYLFHKVVAIVLFHYAGAALTRWTFLAAAVTAAFAVAYLVHRLIERPAQRLLRRRLTAGLAQIRWASDRPQPGPALPPVAQPGPAAGPARADLEVRGLSARAETPLTSRSARVG